MQQKRKTAGAPPEWLQEGMQEQRLHHIQQMEKGAGDA